MSILIPVCRPIRIIAFRGDRSLGFVTHFHQKLDDERNNNLPGPTREECLIYAGHAGVSLDGGTTIFGFKPDPAGTPVWSMLQALKFGLRFHGMVHDDTPVFATAQNVHHLPLLSFDLILPDSGVQSFGVALDRERWKSNYYYGFPGGHGDCNCVTWLERMGLPLVTGRMSEFVDLTARHAHALRRFGLCH